MSDDTDALERALVRQQLVKRAWMGVLAVGLGAAFVVGGGLGLVACFRGSFGRRAPIRFVVAAIIVGLATIAGGVRLLRDGVDDGTGAIASGQARVPFRLIALFAAIFGLAIAALVAWPLGFYSWAGNLSSGCRALLTDEDLSSLSGRAITLDAPSGDAMKCFAAAHAVGGKARAAVIQIGGDMGGSQFDNEVSAFGRGREPQVVAQLGDRAVRFSDDGGTTVLFAVRHAGAAVRLSSDAFDAAAVDRVVDLLRARTHVLDSFDAEWQRQYPGK